MIQKPERDGLKWTPGDDQYLLENAGILKSDVIAPPLAPLRRGDSIPC